jgi:hypothetical protein
MTVINIEMDSFQGVHIHRAVCGDGYDDDSSGCGFRGPRKDTPEAAIAAVAEPQRKAREVRELLIAAYWQIMGGDSAVARIHAMLGLPDAGVTEEAFDAAAARFVEGD